MKPQSSLPPAVQSTARTGRHAPSAIVPRFRDPVTTRWLARRRALITLTKFLLPLGAAALLAAIALWPEFDRSHDNARLTLNNVSGEIDGARLKDARYHGVDEKGRPYTVTAAFARQLDSDRVDLSDPKGDMTREDGMWLMLRAVHGVFAQRANHLDLWQEVTLYRDDGTTLTTSRASVDIKGGSAAGDDPVHVEGPFGTLDSQGFSLTDKGAAIRFLGPSRVVLNGASP